MATSIRLSRGGSKKRPYYRIVVADSRSARDGKYLEQIGTYNPMLPKDSGERVKLNEDRARHWLSVGAQPSDRVHRFLDAAGILERRLGRLVRRVPARELRVRLDEEHERHLGLGHERRVALGLIAAALLSGSGAIVPEAWTLYFLMPLVFAGIALIHAVVTMRKLPVMLLVTFYIVLVLPTAVQLVVLLALLDSWFDIRSRLQRGT